MLPYFSPEQVVLLRYLIACGFYLLLFAGGFFPRPRWRDCGWMLLLGVLGITIYQLFFVSGIARTTAGGASMVVAANPVFASLLAYFFLREKLSALAWGGIAISFIGVGIITFASGTGVGGEVLGYLMMVTAVFSISIYFVFQKPFFARYSPLAMTAYTSIGGTIPLLFWLPQSLEAARFAPMSALVSLVIMGIFSSGIGFLLWFYALAKLPAGKVTSFLFLQPVFVTIIAWFWLSEIPSTVTFIGGVVVLTGVGLILWPGMGRFKRQR